MTKRKCTYLTLSIILIVAMVLISGCQASVTTANLKNIQTASQVDSETHEPIEVKNVFGVNDPIIYVTCDAENVPAGTVVTASWIYLDMDPEFLIDEAELTLEDISSNLAFSLTKPDNGWPVGSYKVELSIDNELVETATFEVE